VNYLIDPENVIDFARTDAELELWWLFSCVVAGKTARTQAKLLDAMLSKLEGETPFEKFRKLSYNRELEEAFIALDDKSGEEIADYDLSVWKQYAKKEAA